MNSAGAAPAPSPYNVAFVFPSEEDPIQLRRGVFAFFIVYLLAVTWPVALPFSSAEPFVMGVPFSLVWPILWIILGGLALWLLDFVEDR
ncbi:MAG: hypothetical protein EA351_00920 [Gemmatimonadales bacterium]|nr:MAG: hypothetical protein EA351_00920 [Gemmatimonadales bacterium]